MQFFSKVIHNKLAAQPLPQLQQEGAIFLGDIKEVCVVCVCVCVCVYVYVHCLLLCVCGFSVVYALGGIGVITTSQQI